MINSINHLPVELLVGIMKRLDHGSLTEAVLTCEKWRDVIECNFPWSIDLDIDSGSHIMPHLIESLKQTNRKIHKLKISNCNGSQDSSVFLELFKYLPNLKEIILKKVYTSQVREDFDLPDLKELKTLRISECNDNIIKCFQTSTLKKLQINDIKMRRSSLRHLAHFVRRQDNLKELFLFKFRETFFQQLCRTTQNESIRFRLGHLHLRDFSYRKHSSSGLVDFIKIHSDTLRILQLDGNFQKPFYEHVFGELKSLKYLMLRFIRENVDFGEASKKNMSIEYLEMFYCHMCPLILIQLCNRMPNVNHLTMQQFSFRALQITSNTLRKVTTLRVTRIDSYFNEITFSNLTSFRIGILHIKFDWNAFTIRNNKITELVIARVENDALELGHIEAITRNLKLHTLILGPAFSADKCFLSVISKNCPDLKVLTLVKSTRIEDIRLNYGGSAQLQIYEENEFRRCDYQYGWRWWV